MGGGSNNVSRVEDGPRLLDGLGWCTVLIYLVVNLAQVSRLNASASSLHMIL